MANQLTGQELLNYLQQQPQNQDLDTTIRGAGYVQNRGGTEGVLRTKFFTAVSAAQGLQLGPSLSRNGQGKDPSFRLKVGPGGLGARQCCLYKEDGLGTWQLRHS